MLYFYEHFKPPSGYEQNREMKRNGAETGSLRFGKAGQYSNKIV